VVFAKKRNNARQFTPPIMLALYRTRSIALNLRLLTISFLFLSSPVLADKCKIEYLDELEYTDIECQFYMGTTAYRNEVYEVAAAHWNFVIAAPLKFEGEDQFQAMALSTVTFLTYQGLGVKQDRNLAVKNWKDAVLKGDFEARRHLGMAYSDKNYKKVDLVKALGWYESIFLVQPDLEVLDESDQGVYQDALDGAKSIKVKLSTSDIQKAMEFAQSTV
jgi:hypothetical protein